MNLKSHTTKTHLKVNWQWRGEFVTLVDFLKVSVGSYWLDRSDTIISWSICSMAGELGRTVVSEILAEALVSLPATPDYLQLVEIIIDDWQSVDRTVSHDQPEELAKVIETLANKRDEIRENLREQPYLNAPVDVAQGRYYLPIAEWESPAKATQRCSERAQ